MPFAIRSTPRQSLYTDFEIVPDLIFDYFIGFDLTFENLSIV